MNDAFRRAAQRTSMVVGSPGAFAVAGLIVFAWALSGSVLGFSDTWQLVINTATTIVTFLIVFLIQNTQNRDSRALHVKLDELILYTRGTDKDFVEIEHLSEEQLQRVEAHFHELAQVLGKEQRADLGESDPSR